MHWYVLRAATHTPPHPHPRRCQVIEETVARLPAPKVVSFLTKVIAKLEAKPSRGQGLAKWIRAVLVQHTAHLMSVPGLVSKLSGLHQVCVVCVLWYENVGSRTSTLKCGCIASPAPLV
jgi:hypothetical protein